MNEALFNSLSDFNKVKKPEFTPNSLNELKSIIADQISKHGNECNLNNIDVSKINNMYKLFYGSSFNGDISDWDVSNVKCTSWMFTNSEFNGDLSLWNLNSLESAYKMFANSKFDGDISDWDLDNDKIYNLSCMFINSEFSGKHTDFSKWDINPEKTGTADMFLNSKCTKIPKWAE